MYYPNDANIILKRVHEADGPEQDYQDAAKDVDVTRQNIEKMKSTSQAYNQAKKSKPSVVKSYLNHGGEARANYKADKKNLKPVNNYIKSSSRSNLNNIRNNSSLSDEQKRMKMDEIKLKAKVDQAKNKYDFETKNAVYKRATRKGRIHGWINPFLSY